MVFSKFNGLPNMICCPRFVKRGFLLCHNSAPFFMTYIEMFYNETCEIVYVTRGGLNEIQTSKMWGKFFDIFLFCNLTITINYIGSFIWSCMECTGYIL